MLPCQKNCPVFFTGCHKTCYQWQCYLKNQTEENRKKRNFLKIHNELSSELIRQYRMLAPAGHRK